MSAILPGDRPTVPAPKQPPPTPVPEPQSAEDCPACCECCMGGNTAGAAGSLTDQHPGQYCVYFFGRQFLRLWQRSMPDTQGVNGGQPIRPVECGYLWRDEGANLDPYPGQPAVVAGRYTGCAPGPHYPGWYPIRITRVKPTRWEGRGVVGGVPVCVRMIHKAAPAGGPQLRVYGPDWTGVMMDYSLVGQGDGTPAQQVFTFGPNRGPNAPFPQHPGMAYAVPSGYSRGEYGTTHQGCEVLAPRVCSRWWQQPFPCLEVEFGRLMTRAELTAAFGSNANCSPSGALVTYQDNEFFCHAFSRLWTGAKVRCVLGAQPGVDCLHGLGGEGIYYGEHKFPTGAVYAVTVSPAYEKGRRVNFCPSNQDLKQTGRWTVGMRYLRGGVQTPPNVSPCCYRAPNGTGIPTDDTGGAGGGTWEGPEVLATEPLPLPDCDSGGEWTGAVTSAMSACTLGGIPQVEVRGRPVTVRVCDTVLSTPTPTQPDTPGQSPPIFVPAAGANPAATTAAGGDCLTCGQQAAAAIAAAEAGRTALPVVPRCLSLGGRREFRPDCQSGYGCRHACRNATAEVASHLDPHPGETTPADDCGPDCPGWQPGPLVWDWRTPTEADPTES